MPLYTRIFSLIAGLTGLLLVVPAQPERPDAKEPDRTFSLIIATHHRKEIFYRDGRGEHRMLPPFSQSHPRPAHLQWFKPHSFLRENLSSRRYRN